MLPADRLHEDGPADEAARGEGSLPGGRTGPFPPALQDAAAGRMLADVAAHGLHIAHVEAGPAGPGHSYSVGLWEGFGQPEVVVFGLAPAVARDLLDLIADEADGGRLFPAGSRSRDLVHAHAVQFLAVPLEARQLWLPLACRAYGGTAFEAVQLVYPDRHGRWPWDPQAPAGFAALQPVLGPPAEE